MPPEFECLMKSAPIDSGLCTIGRCRRIRLIVGRGRYQLPMPPSARHPKSRPTRLREAVAKVHSSTRACPANLIDQAQRVGSDPVTCQATCWSGRESASFC
jgi:hypothetical protein